MSGNLPAGIISDALRPRAGIIARGQHWDVVWFLAHETAAFLFWYLIGMLADSGRSRLGRVMIGYLASWRSRSHRCLRHRLANRSALLAGLHLLVDIHWAGPPHPPSRRPPIISRNPSLMQPGPRPLDEKWRFKRMTLSRFSTAGHSVGRISDVNRWPDLGVRKGWRFPFA
jgi:hypothetical protein